MNGLDLFSGIGGLSKALEPWVRTVAYCERDTFCQAVLLSRMRTRDIDVAPIWDDITTLDNTRLNVPIDIIFGGFPCQDISCAGRGAGLEGERSGLFFEVVRLAKEITPSFIFLENVPAITGRGGLRVVREIAEMGYDCRWGMLSAAEVGALHKRERWFLLGYTKHDGLSTPEALRAVLNARGDRPEATEASGESTRTNCIPGGNIMEWQKIVSEMDKCADGVPDHMARIRALGNSVVPLQVREAFNLLGFIRRR